MNALGLAILILILAVSFAICGVLLGRRLMRNHVAAYHNEVMISLFGMAGVIYAVLLGFLVVVVWEAYDSAHHNVAEEAATLVPLYRLTYGMQGPHGSASRLLIREYADAVIENEWPSMESRNAGSMVARHAIGELDRQFSRLTPVQKAADSEVDAQFLATKSIVVADRNRRLLEATDTIPWVMWLGAVGGGALVMIMSFFIYMERPWPHMLMASLAATLIALLLFIMIVLSRPFKGPLALGPEHFEQALAVMDDADRGS